MFGNRGSSSSGPVRDFIKGSSCPTATGTVVGGILGGPAGAVLGGAYGFSKKK